MTREDLLELIAKALQKSMHPLDEDRARAAADTVLRDLKQAGVTMQGPKEKEPRRMAECFDCARLYGDEHGFPDLIIPLDIWRRISPTGDEGGLLCPSCICKRLHVAGISRCEGAFMSGPIETVSRPLMMALRLIENIHAEKKEPRR